MTNPHSSHAVMAEEIGDLNDQIQTITNTMNWKDAEIAELKQAVRKQYLGMQNIDQLLTRNVFPANNVRQQIYALANDKVIQRVMEKGGSGE